MSNDYIETLKGVVSSQGKGLGKTIKQESISTTPEPEILNEDDIVVKEDKEYGPPDKKIYLKILDFFKDNPQPSDDEVHEFSDREGIDTHEFEEIIYFALGAFVGHGRSKEKGITEKDVDSKELDMGIKVEMEHTVCPIIAKRIALDHLAEVDDYYTRLAKMEKEAGIED